MKNLEYLTKSPNLIYLSHFFALVFEPYIRRKKRQTKVCKKPIQMTPLATPQ